MTAARPRLSSGLGLGRVWVWAVLGWEVACDLRCWVWPPWPAADLRGRPRPREAGTGSWSWRWLETEERRLLCISHTSAPSISSEWVGQPVLCLIKTNKNYLNILFDKRNNAGRVLLREVLTVDLTCVLCHRKSLQTLALYFHFIFFLFPFNVKDTSVKTGEWEVFLLHTSML